MKISDPNQPIVPTVYYRKQLARNIHGSTTLRKRLKQGRVSRGELKRLHREHHPKRDFWDAITAINILQTFSDGLYYYELLPDERTKPRIRSIADL